MLVSGVSFDLNWFLKFIFTVFLVVAGFLYLVKNTASKYFEVDANFEGDQPTDRTPMPGDDAVCASCGNFATKKCSRCKAVRYCSQTCQESHWKSGHKKHCKDWHLSSGIRLNQNGVTSRGYKASAAGKNLSGVALVPVYGTSRPIKKPKDVLFPYDEFVKFFNWQKLSFPPCGLMNCGNSCFANVVLQCLTFTRPLVAYLLEKGHRRECRLNDWCFLCEFQTHAERASQSSHAFSPENILSRLPSIGGNLGYGRQEDAHEFMRFAIDTMQSVCLDEFGGEKSVPPSLQGTTLIQHIFGGRLQSQVFCTKCEKISNQYENMMDLTVEIQGEAASLEECLDQFTGKEWLHGENMYRCDGCNDYVKAWKRFTVKQSPNILTIALKRFQSGRFGKLNKRITFPETLDLSPYMSEEGDGSDKYKLYAVVVHVDMLNASFFGHYICYIKDFQGNWYRIDDWKVINVELEEVLSQGAYMLLYSRVRARPSGLRTIEFSGKEEEQQRVEVELEPGPAEQAECLSSMETVTSRCSEVSSSDSGPVLNISGCENGSGIDKVVREHSEGIAMIAVESTSDVACENSCRTVEPFCQLSSQPVKDLGDFNVVRSNPYTEASSFMEEQDDINKLKSGTSPGLSNHFSCFDKDSSVPIDHVSGGEDSEHRDVNKVKSSTRKGNADYGNGYASGNQFANPLEAPLTVFSGSSSFPIKTPLAEMHQLKQGLPLNNSATGKGNGINRAEI